MSDALTDNVGAILADQLDRALTDLLDRKALQAAEQGEWPARLWDALEGLGLTLALVPENAGGAGLGWREAGLIAAALGRHAAPVPLGETMLAAWLLATAGFDVPPGPIALAECDAVRLKGVAWGAQVPHVATVLPDGRVALIDASALAWQPTATIRREPCAHASLEDARMVATAALPAGMPPDVVRLSGALWRSGQMAGALSAVLPMTVEYVTTRRQFGRPIGKFQAVQQLLATLAAEAAAAEVAAAAAWRAVDRAGLADAAFEIAAAKLRAGEAAGRAAAIAHQVHGAIGFTDEHRLHDFTRRLWTWRQEFGGESFWAARIGRMVLAQGGAALWPFLAGPGETG